MTQTQADDASLFSDDDSTSSIFSSEGETTPGTLEELENEFKVRDELLDRLVKGIDPTYARVMRENEQAVQKKKTLQVLSQKEQKQKEKPKQVAMNITPETTTSSHCSSDDQGDKVPDVNVATRESGFLNRLQRKLSFNVKNRLQAVVILVLNCIAYNGGEHIVRSFVVLLSQSDVEFESQFYLPCALILGSIAVLCFTGGIWDWVNDDTYARVKFDMENQLLLGRWDALVMKWFRRHEVLRTTLNVLAFFTFIYCIYTFQEQVLSSVFDIRHELFQGLPSVKQGVMTYPSKMLASRIKEEEVQRLLSDATCVAGACNMDELHEELTRQDKAFLVSKMAADCYEDLMGNESAILCSESVLFWYYAVSVIVAVVMLRMMGHKFWSI